MGMSCGALAFPAAPRAHHAVPEAVSSLGDMFAATTYLSQLNLLSFAQEEGFIG